MRVAIYYLPEADDPLWVAGSHWLGWDSETAQARQRPPINGLAEASRRASRYGFHATIKAPMPLQGKLDDLLAALEKQLAETPAFFLPPLQLVQEEGFVALRLSQPCPELHALADTCVRNLEPWRRLYTDAELAARNQKIKLPRQRECLERWGYPYVFEEFVFHMTLSDRQTDTRLLNTAIEYFGDIPKQPRRLQSLALVCETDPNAPFTLLRRLPLAPAAPARHQDKP
jgi:hypothetical protein